ncbi:MAG: hypothetical protein JNJ89_19380 [Rubrivivax sp.]|nr:hypothetical protein [Rubrivivax sp.]
MARPTSKPSTPPSAPRRDETPAADRAARVLSALSPARLWRAVFVDQLRLRRQGGKFTVELARTETAAGPGAGATPPGNPAGHPGAAAGRGAAAQPPTRQMGRALGELLGSRAESRRVFTHLVALEQQLLAHDEPAFLLDLSLASLQIMLRQIDGLVAPPAPPGVSRLLAELLDAIEHKTGAEPTQPGTAVISSFFVDHKLEVTELGPAELERLELVLPPGDDAADAAAPG